MHRSNLESKSRPKIKKSTNTHFKKKAIREINEGNYNRAFETLLGNSNRARKVFYKCASQYITKEIKAYPKLSILSKTPMFDYLKLIPWSDIVDEASSSMPFLVHVLKAALPNPAKWKRTTCHKEKLLGQKCLSAKQAKVILDRRLGFMLSVILFSHKPNMYSFIQGCVSVQLRRQYHCGVSLLQCLNGFGVAKGLHATLNLIEALKRQKESSKITSAEQTDQGGSEGASCSSAVDPQSVTFLQDRSDEVQLEYYEEDIEWVKKLIEVTRSMEF